MKKLFYITLILLATNVFAQTKAYKKGEWLKYKLSYSGFLKAGEAELKVTEKTLNGRKVFHAKGTGRTSTVVSWFFKVRDTYQSYFDKDTVKPRLFLRNVYEGGYTINRKIFFHNDKAHITDYNKNTKSIKKAVNVQDMISAFYQLRNHDIKSMKKNDEISMNIFFDGESFPFKLKYLGEETLKTSFGKLKTKIFRPLVQSGRVFKAKESVKIWVTADKNKIPVYIKADLAVGSVRVKLSDYKGLVHKLKTL